MNDKETLDHLWHWSVELLKLAEEKKWNHDNSDDERRYYQGTADTLRKALILLRENDRVAEDFREDWRRVAGGTGRVEPEYLCPEDGSIMRFLFQSMAERRYQCTGEQEHIWAYDWRQAWKR